MSSQSSGSKRSHPSSSSTSSSSSSTSSSPSKRQKTEAKAAPPVELQGAFVSVASENAIDRNKYLADVFWRVSVNDGEPQSMIDLITLKNIFATQLPKMPREYIVRLVLDRKHRSLCLVRKEDNMVVGGICYRPFPTQGFAEVVFCAISTSEQVKGYGRATMSQLKEQIKVDYETLKYPMKMDYFLTFADNHATTFFRKQGFTDKLTIPRDRFSGYIKEYDGGQLMESFISYDIDYSNVPVLVAEQRKRVNGVIQKMSKSHIVYKGLQEFTIAAGEGKKTVVAIEDISGVLDAGWVRRRDLPKRDKDAAQPTPLTDMQARLGMIWKCIRQLKDSWPFQKAVDRKLVSDYYEVIAEPMDLATMNNRLNNSYYVSKESFVYDFMLIINNCKQYNDKGTTYHRCADTLLGAFTGLLQTFGLD